MILVAMLRIKNAILTIDDCLTKLSQLVDEIVIVDNGSTDGTLEIYKTFPKIVSTNHTQGYHEGRDIKLAHEMAKKRKPDWILWIDADEVFENCITRLDLEKYMQNPQIQLVKFRLFHFWLSKKLFRIDGKWLSYSARPQREMWKNQKKAYFHNYQLHHGGIQGINGKQITSIFRIKHFGYTNLKTIKSKYINYNNLKNNPRATKTMPSDTKNMIRTPFLEFTNSIIQTITLWGNYFIWTFIEKIFSLKY